MNHRFMLTLIVMACLVVLVGSGCSMAVRKVGSVATGKKASYQSVSGNEAFLADHKTAIVKSFSTDMGRDTVPFLCSLRSEAISQLKASNLFADVAESISPSSPAAQLFITGRIIDYEAGSKLKRIVTLGGEAFMIVRFEIRDSSGKLLASFNARGFVKDSVTGGDIKDAIPLICKGLVQYIKEHKSR